MTVANVEMNGRRRVAFDSKAVLIDEFLDRLEDTYHRMYGAAEPRYPTAIRRIGIMAMEIISNTDAMYHDAEHSMMVTLVGQEVLRGKHLREGSVSPEDWLHFITSLLCHDIGYVRGICPGDDGRSAVIDAAGNTVELPPGATDAFLTPHHVERGKLFARWRFKDNSLIDPEVISANIENTRFPVPTEGDSLETADYPGLVRAADLLGQLADPDYLRKLVPLFHEFKETGANDRMGYDCPEDVREGYPNFFWQMVSGHVGPALSYLHMTREGRQWEAGLYTHIFSEEHRKCGHPR